MNRKPEEQQSKITDQYEHFQQSDEWKALKESVGNKVFNFDHGWFQTTKLPIINKYIGYVPPIKLANMSVGSLIEEAKKAGCVYVRIDFDVKKNGNKNDVSHHVNPLEIFREQSSVKMVKSSSTRLKYNVETDLTKSIDQLEQDIHRKVRYNIRYADKNGVQVKFEDSKEAFEVFLKLFLDTKARHKFLGRNEEYLRKVWEKLKECDQGPGTGDPNKELRTASTKMKVTIATAYYEEEPVVSWMLVGYGKTLYYPYGGSSLQHKKLRPTYMQAWEVIRWAKEQGYEVFDWMGLEDDGKGNIEKDGFSSFKTQFGGAIVEYEDSVEIVIDAFWYRILKTAEKLRHMFGWLKKVV